MIIQNSLRILNEISEIEKLISQIENTIEKNKLNIDVEALIKNIIDKTEC